MDSPACLSLRSCLLFSRVAGQTIKEDNKELMLRMKNLLKVKGVLRREFKDTKELHLRTRENLAAAMAKYDPVGYSTRCL